MEWTFVLAIISEISFLTTDPKEFGGNKEQFNQLCVVQSSSNATAKVLF